MEEDRTNILKIDNQRIKSLELPMLKKIWPIYDNRHKEVSRYLEKLQMERNKLKQTLAGIKLKKSELEKILLKRKEIYNDLAVRENKIEQELGKAMVMCPIYQFQMSHFLEGAAQCKSEPEDVTALNWHAMEENLIKQKHELENEVQNKQNIIADFIKKYLDYISLAK